MKHVVQLDELEDKSNELINYSKNDINNKIEELRKVVSEFTWKGPSHDAFINGYNERIKKITSINNKMQLFGEFLKFAQNDYKETNAKLMDSWEKYITTLEIIKNK